MNDLSLTKYLTEQVRGSMREDGKVNTLFADDKYKSKIMLEGYTKSGQTNYSMIDWYVMPEKNGTINFNTS